MNEWTLVLETTAPEAEVLLAEGDRIAAREFFFSERSQEVDLFGPLERVLKGLPDGEKLGAVVVGTGPGSYNGARVGIAAAQAVAQARGCPVAGICSFEGAFEWPEGPGVAVGDARRGDFFILRMENGRVRDGVELWKADEFQSKLQETSVSLVTLEDPARLGFPEDLAGRIIQGKPSAEGLLRNWLRSSQTERDHLFQKPVEAFYLRAPHITKAGVTPSR